MVEIQNENEIAPLVEGHAIKRYRLSAEIMAEVPVHREAWDRGKSWMAVIAGNPRLKAGIGRRFCQRAHVPLFYLIESVKIGDAVEFAADKMIGDDRRVPQRWYGVVRAIESDYIAIEECQHAIDAIDTAKRASETDEPIVLLHWSPGQIADLREILDDLEAFAIDHYCDDDREKTGRQIDNIRAALPKIPG